eukprot:g57518.t1
MMQSIFSLTLVIEQSCMLSSLCCTHLPAISVNYSSHGMAPSPPPPAPSPPQAKCSLEALGLQFHTLHTHHVYSVPSPLVLRCTSNEMPAVSWCDRSAH